MMIPTLTFFQQYRTQLRVAFLLMMLAGVLVACDDDDDDGMMATQNIVALAQANNNLSSLEAALTRFPDLVTTLSGSGQFTVFAPSDQAFQDLLSAVGQTSLNDIPDDVLRDVL